MFPWKPLMQRPHPLQQCLVHLQEVRIECACSRNRCMNENGQKMILFLTAAEAAEEALLQCMLEHPQSLFSPLLNQFNTLYQIVRDQKRRPNSTVEETAEDLLVNHSPNPFIHLSNLFINYRVTS